MLSITQTVYVTEYNVDRISRHGATVAVDLAGTNSKETCGIQLDVETWRQVIAAVAPLILCHDAEVAAEEQRLAEEARLAEADTETAQVAALLAS